MKKSLYALALLAFAFSGIAQSLSQYVNPFIGTGGHGHTFPGATTPFGMVQLSPDTRIDGSWDGCSGYHYSDSVIYGFSHTHLNGTGCSDYGDILLMPTMGEPSLDNKVYASNFSHANEQASAGYYAVKLDKHHIDVRLTSSTRVGFHEYTFNQAGQANIILDLNHRDKLLQGVIRILDDKTIEVLRRSEAWAKDQYVFARIEFNTPVFVSNYSANSAGKNNEYTGTKVAMSFSKQVKKGEKILVKVSLSPTGFEGAKLNSSEIIGWDFNTVKQAAAQLWDKELAKIVVNTEDKNQSTIFYTALYHTMMQPNIAQDLDGSYRGRDNNMHRAEGFTYYSVFSLWDTFRAAHPLYTLIDKKRSADFINTFLAQYEQGGRLPVWELASNETDCMIGYHSVSVIADAMAKGIKGFDYEKAFAAAKHSAMLDHLGLDAYKKQGFISMDDEHESVSKTLEYAYDDWCIAQMAKLLNHPADYTYFMKRSQSWKNVFDKQLGFMRPKKNGGWDKPFEPREINNNFTEGNSWQYSFFVPQDIPGLIAAHGGNEKFEAKLDELFTSESKTTGREQADVTGLIGQYAHGNEPSHHMAYLYNYVGKPEKTAQKVTYILDNFYKNAPDGLIGNEDCGQMSAWYVLSAMGIYAVTPGEDKWESIAPQFTNITIKDETNQTLVDYKKQLVNGKSNSIMLAGKKSKEQLVQSRSSAESQQDAVDEMPKGASLLPVPVIQAASKSFTDSLKIELVAQNPTDEIYYSITTKDEPKIVGVSFLYTKPLTISKTSTIKAFSKNKANQSATVEAHFFKKPNNYSINIKSKYNPQYHAGGPDGLLDGILGSENWRKGDWQGYQSQDFEATIDLQQPKTITQICARFLQDMRSWILMPTKVDYLISEDNEHFSLFRTVENSLDPQTEATTILRFTGTQFPGMQARYVKVVAHNFGVLPSWHQGAGGDAFIFIDEIQID